jgi:glycosyltransferase involved in cell wall biosynthesis
MKNPNFAIYYAGDGYSTDNKIMGRQSAGKALMRGMARRWKTSEVHGFGERSAGRAMLAQLQGDGFEGQLRWRDAPGDQVLSALGALYFPSPPGKPLAHARNTLGPASYSLVGVTHTLSSARAMDGVAELILPPFQPWDALICTSSAALSVVTQLQDELRAWFSEHTGATRFNPIAMPVIPLGVNVPDFTRNEAQRAAGRKALGLAPDEIAFLFAGRLAFHAKANPAVFYQAIEAACQATGKALVCIEAGIFPNAGIAAAFRQARGTLAPSARFLEVDGRDSRLYDMAWKAADVFVSLSDNIQETFGLTPVEAMAAGIPVLVSDWDGYKDTVRDGVDGYRIPVILPPTGVGDALAARHALERDRYDIYIGKVSMATLIDLAALTDRVIALAESRDLREQLGAAGQARARDHYDWPVILGRYAAMIEGLAELRKAAGDPGPAAWPLRPDPYSLFADYPTKTLDESWTVEPHVGRAQSIEVFLELDVARYVLDPDAMSREIIIDLLRKASEDICTVADLVRGPQGLEPNKVLALMWLAKLSLVTLKA